VYENSGCPTLNAHFALRVGKQKPAQITSAHAKRTGLKIYPLPNKSVRVRSCGSSFPSEPWLRRTSSSASRSRWPAPLEPLNTFQGHPSDGPGEHTETPGATPRKDFRILKNRPQVNEKPSVDTCGSSQNSRPFRPNPPRISTNRQAPTRPPAENPTRGELCIGAQAAEPTRPDCRAPQARTAGVIR
jgi:hypothetical protein